MFKKDIIAFSVMLLGVVLLSCELPNNTNPENNENGGYTIIFNANGGEGSISSIVFEPEENGRFLPVNNGEIYREGYRFISWNTVPDRVGGTEYMQGRYISAPVDNHVILYAQWIKNIRFVKEALVEVSFSIGDLILNQCLSIPNGCI